MGPRPLCTQECCQCIQCVCVSVGMMILKTCLPWSLRCHVFIALMFYFAATVPLYGLSL